MDRATYIVHPVDSENRSFVDSGLADDLEPLAESMDVYALTQSGYDEEPVGREFYDDTFEDIQSGGKPPSDLLDILTCCDEVYVGGGRATRCVPQSLRSLAYRNVPREDITVGEEISYDIVDGETVSVHEMREREDVDVDEYLSPVYTMAEVDTVL